jgi:hypothetical protein
MASVAHLGRTSAVSLAVYRSTHRTRWRDGPLTERGGGDKAAKLWLKPVAPIGAFGVANVGYRLWTTLRGWRNAPAHHREIASPITVELDDRRHCVGIDGWQIELNIIANTREIEQADHFLARSAHTVKIAHWPHLIRYRSDTTSIPNP